MRAIDLSGDSRFATQNGKHSKYGAKKTVVDGITFDSKREAERYCELKLLLRGKAMIDCPVFDAYDYQSDCHNSKPCDQKNNLDRKI